MGSGKHGGGGSHGGGYYGGGGGGGGGSHYSSHTLNNIFFMSSYNDYNSNNYRYMNSPSCCFLSCSWCCFVFLMVLYLLFVWSMAPATTLITMDVGETRLYGDLNSWFDKGITFRDLTGDSIKVNH